MYLYALADTVALPPGACAWNGNPLVTVDAGVCLAITAEVEAAPLPTAAHLRAQDTLLRALMPGSAALLPARFGTVVADVAALRARLAPDRAGILRALALVRHREQMTLRLVARGPEPQDESIGAEGEAASPGRRYLERRAARLAPPPALTQLVHELGPLVRHARLQHGRAPGRVTTAYHLIERGDGDAYRACVERSAAALADVSVLLTGPGPAYAFTDISGS